MPYKYINYGISGSSASPRNQLRDGFQALIDSQFYNSTSIQTIMEEVVFGSGSFSSVDVRVNRAINSTNGEKLSDDFKQILFRDLGHATSIGYKYYFNDNYWIVTFSEIIMSLGTSCMVRRCNEYLRWIDEDGNYYEEPCAIDYKISRPRDSMGAENPVMPQGFTDVFAQLNDKTKKIRGNQRFLFGTPNNRVCMKVFGNGVQNMIRQETTDENSQRLVTLSMGGNFVNYDTDDVVGGIADRYKDYNIFTSGSTSGSYYILISPETASILENDTKTYNVQYYSGSVPSSGSFVFSVSGSSVPASNYSFSQIDGNNFYIVNNQQWAYNKLDVLANGASGSRLFSIELKGAW